MGGKYDTSGARAALRTAYNPKPTKEECDELAEAVLEAVLAEGGPIKGARLEHEPAPGWHFERVWNGRRFTCAILVHEGGDHPITVWDPTESNIARPVTDLVFDPVERRWRGRNNECPDPVIVLVDRIRRSIDPQSIGGAR